MANSNSSHSNVTKKEYTIAYLFNCDSSNVVYLIDCIVCGFQYVGSPSTPFRLRFDNYEACCCKFKSGSSVPQMDFCRHFMQKDITGFWRTFVFRLQISLSGKIGYLRVSGNTSQAFLHSVVLMLRKQKYSFIVCLSYLVRITLIYSLFLFSFSLWFFHYLFVSASLPSLFVLHLSFIRSNQVYLLSVCPLLLYLNYYLILFHCSFMPFSLLWWTDHITLPNPSLL